MSGVLRKIIAQTRAWREFGWEAQVFALAPHKKEPLAEGYANVGAAFGIIPQSWLDACPFARLGYLNKIATVQSLKAAISKFCPDAIYYRQQGTWYPGVERLLRIASTIMEINANKAERDHWGWMLSGFVNATQERVTNLINGFVCVSHKIADEYRDFGKPVAVVP